MKVLCILHGNSNGNCFWELIPVEPSRARLLTALTVTDSYVTTLLHAEDSFRAFAVSIA